MQWREHDELDWGHRGSWPGILCPFNQSSEASEKEICSATPRSMARTVQYTPDTARILSNRAWDSGGSGALSQLRELHTPRSLP